jgi:DNA helicase-2/ATP-dependent DNA helicase PcrA
MEATMLNDKQQQAVLAEDRFIFLYAGAGTGKTTVMIARIKRLIDDGIDPSKILGLTFTNKAAHHMKLKLGNEDVVLKTFHAWAHTFVQKNFVQQDIPFSKDFLKRISQYKNKHLTHRLPWYFSKYQQFLQKNQVIDYDDVLIKAIHEKGFNQRYSHILIDEFQDTNLIQLQLLKQLIQTDTHVFAVGDPDQSIYRFRGAIPNVVDVFIKRLHAKTYTLDINYRSDQNIILKANQVINKNKERYKKVLIPYSQQKGSISIKHYENIFHEALSTISIIEKHALKSVLITARTHERLFDIKRLIFEKDYYFSSDHVMILTIHQAKGLEFDHVFIIGMEEGVLPLGKYLSKEAIEEERRLFFVAVTRARHNLFFSHIKTYQNKKTKPSQFLMDFLVTSRKIDK